VEARGTRANQSTGIKRVLHIFGHRYGHANHTEYDDIAIVFGGNELDDRRKWSEKAFIMVEAKGPTYKTSAASLLKARASYF
jgi:hypothetical protein